MLEDKYLTQNMLSEFNALVSVAGSRKHSFKCWAVIKCQFIKKNSTNPN